MRTLFSIAAFTFLAGPVLAGLTDSQIETVNNDIVGAWKLDFTTPDDVTRAPMVLVGRQHQELVAWYIENDKPEAIKKVDLNDDTLTLAFRPNERRDVTVTFKATLESQGVCVGTGTYTSDDGESGSWDIKGKRVQPSDIGETESWQLSFVTPDDQEREAVITVVAKNDNIYGWYSSEKYELPAKKLSMNGDTVTMSLSTKTGDGTNIDVTFSGKVDGDRVSGEAEFDLEGEAGSFPFQGKRKS